MSAAMKRWVARLPGVASLRAFIREHLLANYLRRRRFESAYTSNYWRGDESRSGRGSSSQQTEAIRAALPDLCAALHITSMLDVPCGDFHWMRLVDLSGVAYTGVDIVPALVAANMERYGRPGRAFVQLDIVTSVPPRADLVLCRDLLVHLPYCDIMRAMDNIRRSGAIWLLTTTFCDRSANADIEDGDWRPLNLELPPFAFPPPHRLINERCSEKDGVYADKSLGLWRVDQLPDLLHARRRVT